jgi:hypothetical protein
LSLTKIYKVRVEGPALLQLRPTPSCTLSSSPSSPLTSSSPGRTADSSRSAVAVLDVQVVIVPAIVADHEILVRIRIRESIPLNNGFGCGSCYFSQ